MPPSWPPVRCAGRPCRSVDGVERTRAGQRRFFVNTAKGPEAHHEVSLSVRSNFEYNIADLLALAMFSAPRTGLTQYLTPLKAFVPSLNCYCYEKQGVSYTNSSIKTVLLSFRANVGALFF